MIYLELFWTFFQVGLLGFGGGYAFLPLMESLVVGAGFLSSSEFLRLLAVAEVTPGPIGLNTATYVGLQTGGWAGAAVANFGVASPSLLLILSLAGLLSRWREGRLLRGLFAGLRPVTIALILAAAWTVGRGGLFEPAFSLWGLALFALCAGLSFVPRLPPLALMLGAGVIGSLLSWGQLW